MKAVQVLLRPHQHIADAPMDCYVTSLHTIVVPPLDLDSASDDWPIDTAAAKILHRHDPH